MNMITLKITDKKSGKVQQSDFSTREQAESWLKKMEDKSFYGNTAYDKHIPETGLKIPAVLDPDSGKEISPARIELVPAHTIHVEQSYLVEYIDNTEKEQAETLKKSAKVARVNALKAIDWATVKTIADMKNVVKNLVEELLEK